MGKSRFRRRVGHESWKGHAARQRGDIHNVAASAAKHSRDRLPAQFGWGEVVNLGHSSQVIVEGVSETRDVVDARIVDEDVDRPDFVLNAMNQGGDLRRVRQVGNVGRTSKLDTWLDRRCGDRVRYPAALPAAVALTNRITVHSVAAADYFPHPQVAFVPLDGPECEITIAVRSDDHRPPIEVIRNIAPILSGAATAA